MYLLSVSRLVESAQHVNSNTDANLYSPKSKFAAAPFTGQGLLYRTGRHSVAVGTSMPPIGGTTTSLELQPTGGCKWQTIGQSSGLRRRL